MRTKLFDRTIQQKTLKEKGYLNIYNKFMIVNYTENKNKDWSKLLGMATFWGKPVLLVINRSFLYHKNIKILKYLYV